MKKVLLLQILLLLSFQSETKAKDIEVCGTCSIKSIAEAIRVSFKGDQINIKPGKYEELGLTIDHSLTLNGYPGAELRYRGEGSDMILISAPNTVIQGLKIIGSGKSSFHDFSAIKVRNTADCLVKNNEIIDSQYGILIANSTGCQVIDNRILTSSVPTDLLGDGIHFWKSDNPKIAGNRVQGHRDGIYLEFVRNGSIENNIILKNHRYGLHFMFSSDNAFLHNRFQENDAGVAVMYSKRIKMVQNEYSKNKGAASFGLLLKDISDSVIVENSFLDNTVAIFMEGSNRNNFSGNVFDQNGWAVRLLSSCEANTFIKNSFLNNTLEIATNSQASVNKFAENYWAQHNAVDIDGDGFTDLPYQPTSFSSYLVEKYNLSVLLLGTPFLSFLDYAEQLFPALSPVELRDAKPLMARPGGLL